MAVSDYSERATRIIDRVMPKNTTPHGFYNPAGFVGSCVYETIRRRAYWMTFARLRAKAEGGRPYVELPPRCEHLFNAGNPMFDVSKYLAECAA